MVIICDGTCIIFDGETKYFNVEATEIRWGECVKLKLGGETILLAGHPFTLAGQRSSGLVTGGCSKRRQRHLFSNVKREGGTDLFIYRLFITIIAKVQAIEKGIKLTLQLQDIDN